MDEPPLSAPSPRVQHILRCSLECSFQSLPSTCGNCCATDVCEAHSEARVKSSSHRLALSRKRADKHSGRPSTLPACLSLIRCHCRVLSRIHTHTRRRRDTQIIRLALVPIEVLWVNRSLRFRSECIHSYRSRSERYDSESRSRSRVRSCV